MSPYICKMGEQRNLSRTLSLELTVTFLPRAQAGLNNSGSHYNCFRYQVMYSVGEEGSLEDKIHVLESIGSTRKLDIAFRDHGQGVAHNGPKGSYP